MLARLSYESRCKRAIGLMEITVEESQYYIVIVVSALLVGLPTATHAS